LVQSIKALERKREKGEEEKEKREKVSLAPFLEQSPSERRRRREDARCCGAKCPPISQISLAQAPTGVAHPLGSGIADELERSAGMSARCHLSIVSIMKEKEEREKREGRRTYVEPPNSNTGRRQLGYPDTAAVGGELGAVGGGGEVLNTTTCAMKRRETGRAG
jgi:hypothetical protein